MPNSIIVAGTAIIMGSVHLHHRQSKEVEDKVAVSGISEDGAGDKEEDVVGDNRVPKEC